VLVNNVLLFNLNSSFQNSLVKILSLSDTIDLGMPCSLTIVSRITCAICCAEKGCLRGIK
jgi:hypothetical protein